MIEKIKKILNSNYSDEVILATTLGNLILIFFADGFIVVIDTENQRLTRMNIHEIEFRDYLNQHDYSDNIIAEYEKMEEMKQLVIYIFLRFEHNSDSRNQNHVIASVEAIFESGKEFGTNKSSPENLIIEKNNFAEKQKIADLYSEGISDVIKSLTQQQLKVFCGKMIDGKTEVEIAKELGISRSSVQCHWQAVQKKFRNKFPDFP